MIPICLQHDHKRIVGEFRDGEVTLSSAVDMDRLFKIFGNCGIRTVDMEEKEDGRRMVKKFRIIEWSVDTL